MIKKSLTAKLFLFVLLLFVTQVLIQLGFQKYFLADYYESQKSEFAESEFYNTIEEFEDADDLTHQSEILYDYIASTDEPILVFNELLDYHQASYITSFEQTVRVELDGETFLMPFNLSDADLDMGYIDEEFSYELIGEEIFIVGYMENDTFTPVGFEYDGYFFDSYVLSNDEIIQDDLELYEENYDYIDRIGTIVNVEDRLIGKEMQKKINDLSDYYYKTTLELSTDFEDYNFMMDTVIIAGEELTFVSALSLQPINEVLEIQSKFQLYLTGFMLILIIIVSYVFSKVISKPIVAISKSTAEISNLNFDETCDESREDEIGILGRSINLLSKSLKDKIDTLEDEIAFEKRQEKIRREFVADVSHELKTPLGIIRSYSEGIKDGISQEKATYYLDVIIEEVDKMNELVLDMLELSNLESKQMIQKERINIKRLINNVLRSYAHVSKDMNVAINMEDLIVDVDIKKMELVMSNLLSNAFRYVDDRKLIRISIKDHTLYIENSHEPIGDDELSKLWDRFYRLEKSRSRTFGGNGLGLAIVQKTLELHEIDYSIENSEIGFLFKIRF